MVGLARGCRGTGDLETGDQEREATAGVGPGSEGPAVGPRARNKTQAGPSILHGTGFAEIRSCTA